jgi:hypothetical protein
VDSELWVSTARFGHSCIAGPRLVRPFAHNYVSQHCVVGEEDHSLELAISDDVAQFESVNSSCGHTGNSKTQAGVASQHFTFVMKRTKE